MVCTANELSAWKDFPKGLKVLLLDRDDGSAAEIKLKLEALDYVVHTFCNQNDALTAFSSIPENFHIAIVEVNTSNNGGSFRFLEAAKGLPTIMISDIHCLDTIMKCIALGAVEFLRKPLSEDKLRNIWQHVVHKAFSAGGNVLSEPLKPVNGSVVSMLHPQLENGNPMDGSFENVNEASPAHENDCELSVGSDRYPAPSTPQLKQGIRFLDDVDMQEHTNSSTEKDSGEHDGESKFVETTCGTTTIGANAACETQRPRATIVKEEDDSADVSKSDSIAYPDPQDNYNHKAFHAAGVKPTAVSRNHNSCASKTNRKKLKVDWTSELHRKFVEAVEQLGVDQAIPSQILEVMKVDGLTRHNVASHLQKYRMHKRYILPKEDNQRLSQRDQIQRNYYQHKPVMAFPTYHTDHVRPAAMLYPTWGAPHPNSIPIWSSPGYLSWQHTESGYWKPYPGMHADAWGCPVMSPPQGFFPSFPQNTSGANSANSINGSCHMPLNFPELQPAEDVIDKVVKEAISKPWLPLPLGLKPPSAECVLAELSRQGIPTIPRQTNSSALH